MWLKKNFQVGATIEEAIWKFENFFGTGTKNVKNKSKKNESNKKKLQAAKIKRQTKDRIDSSTIAAHTYVHLYVCVCVDMRYRL